MRYVGSKNKISGEIVPIIQKCIDDNNIENYYEPFVGGANMIDKIRCRKRIGNDIHRELIELLKQTQNNIDIIPDRIYEHEYIKVRQNKEDYPYWYVGLVGFCASFGAKYFGGYARNSKDDNSGSWSEGAIRNLKKQSVCLKDVLFTCEDFLSLDYKSLVDYVIYCDPPYQNTTKYKTGDFNHDTFWDWVRKVSVNNYVLVSEYNAPDDFVCIWDKELKILLDSNKIENDTGNIRTEKLFTYNSGRYAKQYLEKEK